MSFLDQVPSILLQTFPSRLSPIGNGFLICPNVIRAVSSGCNPVQTSQGGKGLYTIDSPLPLDKSYSCWHSKATAVSNL